ncbi:MAG TPA: efflux RND transporter periplasmic adaptor subunit [Caulobacteraceae bacterium]|jgi:HlyD family secretion protein|nr:efflux RND transporter periplasmic adaptor subunit [Caulobacteraceae bacterium]
MRISAALALMAALALGGCSKPPPAAGPPGGVRTVRVALVEPRPLTGGLETSGVLISREEAAVNAEQLLGGYRVMKVFVEADAYVKQGQPLAQLDDTLLRSQIAQAQAQVDQQKVAADQADLQAKDVQGLDKEGIISTEQIDQRRFQARSAHAAVDAATAQLRDLQTRDARMIIRAPVAGLVLTRNVRPGDIAGGGTSPMFTLARDGLVELEAQVAEGDISGIHVGDAVQVTLPDGSQVRGSVRLIEPNIDPQTKLGKVHIQLPVNSDLRPGGFGRASFVGLTRTVSTAPETAIRYDADGASVMLVGPDNHVQQVPVKTGAHEGGYVELVRGPPSGSRVLLGSSAFVLPGDTVNPIADTTLTAAP